MRSLAIGLTLRAAPLPRELPVASGRGLGAETEASRTKDMPKRLKASRVLVADPSYPRAALIASALRGIGVRNIALAGSSDEIDSLLSDRHFDAAVVSFDIRPKPVAELVSALRRGRSANAHLPVLAVGGRITFQELNLANLAGVNRVLEMPISGDILRDRLLAILRNDPSESGGFQEI